MNGKTRPKLRHPVSKFILEEVKKNITDTCAIFGFSIGIIPSETAKELAILKDDTVVAYISRSVGLGKGVLNVVINPRYSCNMDALTADISGISIRTYSKSKSKSRYISSSNYWGFKSIGFCNLLESNEHAAAGYKIDFDQYIEGLSLFLGCLQSLYKIVETEKI